MRDNIKYQIISLSISSEVFLSVINDMVCTERTHKVLLARIIHPGNLSPIQFGKLHCKRTGATAGPIDQHLLPRLDLSFIANPLQGDHCRLRDGSYFLECHTRWFQRQGTFTSTHVLGKTTHTRQDVSEDFIPWLKSPDVSASHLNSPGYVRS